jgi:hypothetical protein
VQDIPNNGAVGEFLGISAGGVLDWLPVASGGGDMLKSENLSGLASYPTARTNLGLGTTDTPTFKNLVISTGSIATSAPVTISQTWDALAVAFTAFKVNATSTNSAAGSLLLDLQTGGVSRLQMRKDGLLTVSDVDNGTRSAKILISQIDRGVILYPNLGGGLVGPTYYSTLTNGGSIRFLAQNSASTETFFALYDEGVTNTLALRNGINPQTFNVYGTYTSGSVYERMFAKYNGTALAFQIGTEQTGATSRPLEFITNGTRKFEIAGSGINTSTFYGHANTNSTILVLRTLSGSAKSQYYVNPSGNVEFALGGFTTAFPILLSESGTSHFNGGNVGIGTTAPAEKLHVLGGKVLFGDAADATGAVGNGDLTLRAYRTPQIHISANNSSGVFYGLNIELNNNIYAGLLLNLSSGEVKIGALAATYFPTFYSNNVERMRIDTAGNVGIGTTAPSSKLHVAGNSSPAIAIENTIATGYSELLFKNTVATGSSIFLNGSTQTGYGGANSLNVYTSNGPLAFHTASVTNAISLAQSGDFKVDKKILGNNGINIGNTANNYDRAIIANSGGGLAITNGGSAGESLQFTEMTAPAAPAANQVRIYAEDDGTGKTRLMALFATGVAQQIAIQP